MFQNSAAEKCCGRRRVIDYQTIKYISPGILHLTFLSAVKTELQVHPRHCFLLKKVSRMGLFELVKTISLRMICYFRNVTEKNTVIRDTIPLNKGASVIKRHLLLISEYCAYRKKHKGNGWKRLLNSTQNERYKTLKKRPQKC